MPEALCADGSMKCTVPFTGIVAVLGVYAVPAAFVVIVASGVAGHVTFCTVLGAESFFVLELLPHAAITIETRRSRVMPRCYSTCAGFVTGPEPPSSVSSLWLAVRSACGPKTLPRRAFGVLFHCSSARLLRDGSATS